MAHNAASLYAMIHIFKKNYGVEIDTHEIDTTLTYAENWNILYAKYVNLTYHSLEEL